MIALGLRLSAHQTVHKMRVQLRVRVRPQFAERQARADLRFCKATDRYHDKARRPLSRPSQEAADRWVIGDREAALGGIRESSGCEVQRRVPNRWTSVPEAVQARG